MGHYMTYDERLKLEAYLEAGQPVRWIAQQLGFCTKTIYNEMKRGAYTRVVRRNGYDRDETHYSADVGQQVHDYNQTAKGRPLKIGNDHEYAGFLERKMLGIQENGKADRRKRLSPAAALAEARREGFRTTVCVGTLYSYIKKGVFLNVTQKHLWNGGKKKQNRVKVRRIAHPKLPSIAQRPEWVNDRSELGHWEMDLVSSCVGSNTALLTLTERVSRQEIIRKIPDKKASTIRKELSDLQQQGYMFKSLTTDNGVEFLEYNELKKTLPGTEIYYCHSYAAYEKGSNENHNRMIRRWFPKGTDFAKVPKKEITELQDWMNGYPRKILDWNRPIDYAV